mmetsp:Transcript_6882/g.12157  ORF Transcript_6882/g.12157 Transcript_6882/m.12157 type:complete len:112 (+) Transcript_6882:1-336(+)
MLLAQVAQYKAAMSSVAVRNTELERALQEGKEKYERDVTELQDQVHAIRDGEALVATGPSQLSPPRATEGHKEVLVKSLEEELERSNRRNALLQQQYTKLYEYVSGTSDQV